LPKFHIIKLLDKNSTSHNLGFIAFYTHYACLHDLDAIS